MLTPDLNNHSAIGRVKIKGVTSIAEILGPFQSEVRAFDYMLTCDAISIPNCDCGRPMVHRSGGYICHCRSCKTLQS
jgi:hypothetical protein